MRIIFFTITLTCISGLHAQMSGYWSESFNTKASLLSGAVVGGYEDESSIYYNPSILSDSGESKLTFAAGLFTFDHTRFENALGDGQNAIHYSTSVAPNFISVHLYPKDPFALVWQAAIFTKTKYDGYINQEVRMNTDILQYSVGQEQYLGRFSVRNEFEDTWFGIGIAKFIGDQWSIGTSLFGQYKHLRYTYKKASVAMPDLDLNANGHVAQNLESITASATNWRTVAKIGVNWQINDEVAVGLVTTIPSIRVMGKSEVVLSAGIVNIADTETGDFYADFAIDERGTEMKADFKDPMSIALGIDWKLDKWRWNITTEWFSKLDAYRIIDERTGDVFVSASGIGEFSGENLSFVGGGNNVLNFAIGVEQYVSEKRSRIFGFKTNFDARNNFSYGELDGLNKLLDVRGNYFNFSGGTNFSFLNFNILFGLQYAFSSNEGLRQFANFTSPQEIIPSGPYVLEGVPKNNMTFKGKTISLFISLTLK